MIKLIIKKPGLFLSIPGITSFRTPSEVDITKINMNIVISELRKNGIERYKITSDNLNELDGVVKKVSNKKEKFKTQVSENTFSILVNNELAKSQTEILDKIKDQQTTIDKIESLLERFLNSNPKVLDKDLDIIPEITKKKNKSKFDDSFDDFIPVIDLNKIKFKSSENTTKKINTKTNLNDSKILQDITDKK